MQVMQANIARYLKKSPDLWFSDFERYFKMIDHIHPWLH